MFSFPNGKPELRNPMTKFPSCVIRFLVLRLDGYIYIYIRICNGGSFLTVISADNFSQPYPATLTWRRVKIGFSSCAFENALSTIFRNRNDSCVRARVAPSRREPALRLDECSTRYVRAFSSHGVSHAIRAPTPRQRSHLRAAMSPLTGENTGALHARNVASALYRQKARRARAAF